MRLTLAPWLHHMYTLPPPLSPLLPLSLTILLQLAGVVLSQRMQRTKVLIKSGNNAHFRFNCMRRCACALLPSSLPRSLSLSLSLCLSVCCVCCMPQGTQMSPGIMCVHALLFMLLLCADKKPTTAKLNNL